jgi:RNA polymerase sigma-70 factor, ECF subfamily
MSAGRRLLFEQLFVQHGAALRRYVRRFVGSGETAEDIVQETFLRAYAQPAQALFPKAFLFTIAHNLSMKWLRRRKTAATDSMGDLDAVGVYELSAQLDGPLIADEELRLLKEAVEQLPPQCRAAFALRVFQAQSYGEIARALGISTKTVEKHISRGIRETHAYLRHRYALQVAEADKRQAPAEQQRARPADESAEGNDG